MKKRFSFLITCTAFVTAYAQPATEVYLFDLDKSGSAFSISNPVNVSLNLGNYDNQPSFSPDGQTLYFVSADAGGNTDIQTYQVGAGEKTVFRNTEWSEYSPTVTPDGQHLSCIMVRDDTQLLWKYPISGGDPVVVVPELVIGYHAWLNDQVLAAFVLGETMTLQVCDLKANTNEIVAKNIGRSLHKIPGKSLISFLQLRDDQPALIQSLNPKNGKIKTITTATENSQDMAWSSDGAIFMGQGTDLMVKVNPKKDEWVQLDDMISFGLGGITRLAVSPKGDKLAVVINE